MTGHSPTKMDQLVILTFARGVLTWRFHPLGGSQSARATPRVALAHVTHIWRQFGRTLWRAQPRSIAPTRRFATSRPYVTYW